MPVPDAAGDDGPVACPDDPPLVLGREDALALHDLENLVDSVHVGDRPRSRLEEHGDQLYAAGSVGHVHELHARRAREPVRVLGRRRLIPVDPDDSHPASLSVVAFAAVCACGAGRRRTRRVGSVRRLLVFAIAVVFVESIFFAALAPLLPELTDDLGLSTFGAGVLVAAYAFGALLGAIPSGLAVSRLGVRPTVLWGLGLLAVTCVAFGFVDSYALLVGARIGQGVAASFLWTGALAWLVDAAPADRRGEYLGYTTSGAIAGSLVGPLLGGAASHFGRGATFAGVAVLSLLLATWALRIPVPEAEPSQPIRMLFTTLRSRRVLAGMWLIALPSLALGLVFVLGPLQLDAAGFGALGVTAVFLLAAACEAAVGPGVGIWSDRRDRLAR